MTTNERKFYENVKKGELSDVRKSKDVCYDMLLLELRTRSDELDSDFWDTIRKSIRYSKLRNSFDIDKSAFDLPSRLFSRHSLRRYCLYVAACFEALVEYLKEYSGPEVKEWDFVATIAEWRRDDCLYVANRIKDGEYSSIIEEFGL